MMEAWGKLRRHPYMAKLLGQKYCRVVQAGTKNGRPHIHLVLVDSNVPLAGRVLSSPANWYAGLSQATKDFYKYLRKIGFGFYNYETLRHGM